ncbi:MAG TPA: hypothetical protein PKM95_03920, partial [Deltaproteobacteria bacterium]|nr:hypothetical protein [Deltaproteobacteria bacterium]
MEKKIDTADTDRLKQALQPYLPGNIITDMFEDRVLTDLWDVLYTAVEYYTGGEKDALEAVRKEKVESVDQLLDRLRWWGKSAESPLDIERIKELLEPYLPEDVIDEALLDGESGDLKDLLTIAVDYFTDGDRRAMDSIKSVEISGVDDLLDQIRWWYNATESPDAWYDPVEGKWYSPDENYEEDYGDSDYGGEDLSVR